MKKIIITLFIAISIFLLFTFTNNNHTSGLTTVNTSTATSDNNYKVTFKWFWGSGTGSPSSANTYVIERTFYPSDFPLRVGWKEVAGIGGRSQYFNNINEIESKDYSTGATYNSISPTLNDSSIYSNVGSGGSLKSYRIAATIYKDATSPSISLGTDGSSTWDKSHSTIVYASDSQAGIASKQYAWSTSTSTSGLNWKTLSSTSVTTPNESGKWYLFVKATDKVGNSKTVRSNQFYVDVDEPTISFGTNGSSTWKTSHNTTVTVNDSHSAIKTKQYTWSTSSTTPTSNWTNFSSNTITTPSNITSGKWYLHIKATDNAGNINTTRSNQFYIDVDKPTISFSQNGSATYSQYHSTTVTTNDSLSGVKTKQYAWTTTADIPSGWLTMTNETLTTPRGSTAQYYLHVKITDNAGNEMYKRSDAFNVDDVPPVINTDIEEITHEMGTTFDYYNYGTCGVTNADTGYAGSTCNFSTIDVNTLGIQTLTISASDEHGNTTSKTITVTIVDTKIPDVIFTPNGNNSWAQTQSVEVSFIDDGAGCKEYRYIWTQSDSIVQNWNGTALVNDCNNASFELLQDGIWYLHIKVSDNEGNTGYYRSNAFKRDTTKPVVSIDTEVINHEINTEFDFNNYGTCTVIDNSNEEIQCEFSDIDTSSLGENNLTITATDAAGNKTIKTIIVNIVDTQAPEITVNTNDIIHEVNTPFTPPTCSVEDNSGEILECVFSTVDTSKLGEQTLTVTATDSSENKVTVEIVINVVDGSAPVIDELPEVIFEVGDTNIFTSYDWKETVSAYVKDVGTSFEDLLFEVNASQIVKINEIGVYTVTYKVTDTDGNYTEATRTVKVVDTTKPMVSIDTEDIVVELFADFANPTCSVTDNSGELIKCVFSEINTNKLGEQTLTVTATDSSGNKSIVEVIVNVVDTEKPMVSIDTEEINHEINTEFNFNDYGTCTVTDNAKEKIDCVFSEIDTSKLGKQVLLVTATDSSGNETVVEVIVNIIDTTAPVVSIDTKDVIVEVFSEFVPKTCDVTDNSKEEINCVFSEVDTSKLGKQVLLVTATDSSGNETVVEVIVNIIDITAPIFTKFKTEIYIKNEVVDENYILKYFEATDNYSGGEKITYRIKGDFNLMLNGKYKVDIVATDEAGNIATMSTTIIVEQNQTFASYIVIIAVVLTFGVAGLIMLKKIQ